MAFAMATSAVSPEQNAQPKTKVFVSYSRKDTAFADRLDPRNQPGRAARGDTMGRHQRAPLGHANGSAHRQHGR